MNNDKVKASESKDQPGKVSTCFEGSPCAELLQEVLGERGIGSLSHEIMRSSMDRDRRENDRPQEAREEGHGHEK